MPEGSTQFDAVTNTATQEVPHATDEPGHVHRRGMQLLSASERQEPSRQPRTTLGRANGAFDEPMAALIATHALLQKLEIAEDRHQQVIEVVRHTARELAEAVKLLDLVNLRQGRFAFACPLLDALFEFGIGFLELDRTLFDAPL